MNNNTINQRPHQPLSSSSSSSSSSITLNTRIINGLKQRSQDTMLQQNYASFQTNERQQSPMLPISPRMNYFVTNEMYRITFEYSLDDSLSINFAGAASGTSTMNDTNLTSPVTTCQDIR